MTAATDVDVSTLCEDGDTLEIDETRTLRLRVEPDDRSLLDDQGPDMWCGELEWVRPNRDYVGRYMTRRPDGYNGRARILERDNGYALWWQPPTDVPDDRLDSFAATLRDLLEYGYVGIVLELLEGTDAYGRPIVTRSESLWGVEWNADRHYVDDVVSDLWAEMTQRTYDPEVIA